MTFSQLFSLLFTVLGWFAAFHFSQVGQRRNVQNGVKLKVFEEFWRLRNILQDSMNNAAQVIASGPPIELMQSAEVYGNFTKRPEDMWNGQQDAVKFLNNYLKDLFEAKANFHTTYLNFMRAFEMWLHVMPGLQAAAADLFDEYTSLNTKINEYYTFLQTTLYQWKEWDPQRVRDHAKSLAAVITDGIKYYTEDIMALIHNELLQSFFEYRKDIPKPGQGRAKVLTKKGLMVTMSS